MLRFSEGKSREHMLAFSSEPIRIQLARLSPPPFLLLHAAHPHYAICARSNEAMSATAKEAFLREHGDRYGYGAHESGGLVVDAMRATEFPQLKGAVTCVAGAPHLTC